MISKTYEVSILNAIAQCFNGGSSVTTTVNFPTKGYLALFTVAPGRNASTGELTTGTEVSGGGYARVNLKGDPLSGGHYFNTTAGWSTDHMVIANSVAIQFPMATADWGNVVAFGIYDDATSGNLTMAGYLVDSNGKKATVLVEASNAVAFAPGQLQISLTDTIPADPA